MIFLYLFNIFFSIKSFDEPSCLSLELKSDQILHGKDTIELVFSAKNCSKNNLILYNLAEAIETNQFEESFYCQLKITAGITLFIYDANSEMMWPDVEFSDSIAYRPNNEEQLIKAANQVRNKFRRNMMLAKAYQNLEIKRTVDLRFFHLKKGTYRLMLVYFAGENISNLISVAQMEADQRKLKAKIYQGCARSNTVKLVVE